MTLVHRVMAASPIWLSLTDLGRIFGISAVHCGRNLEQLGWRDRRGLPSPEALESGAAKTSGPHGQSQSTLWNREICGGAFEDKGYRPMPHSQQVQQWTYFLEAMAEGSPSINATVEQMAEDIPGDLVEDVNHQLAARGCRFRVPRTGAGHHTRRSASAC